MHNYLLHSHSNCISTTESIFKGYNQSAKWDKVISKLKQLMIYTWIFNTLDGQVNQEREIHTDEDDKHCKAIWEHPEF